MPQGKTVKMLGLDQRQNGERKMMDTREDRIFLFFGKILLLQQPLAGERGAESVEQLAQKKKKIAARNLISKKTKPHALLMTCQMNALATGNKHKNNSENT